MDQKLNKMYLRFINEELEQPLITNLENIIKSKATNMFDSS